MINTSEILETIAMIRQEHLDVRTITMGISLLDCMHDDPARAADAVYDKIMRRAGHLVETGEAIEKEYGIPIINKRVSVTPIAIVGQSCGDYLRLAKSLDRAAHDTGINFIGGYSALVQKGCTDGDVRFLSSIPQALAETNLVCSSVNVASTKAGINMEAIAKMGQIIKETAALTAENGGMGCAKLVVFANAVEDNPFMAGAFHGVGSRNV